jgi:hypothetical protein
VELRLLLPDARRYLLVKVMVAALSVIAAVALLLSSILALCGWGSLILPALVGLVLVGLLWAFVAVLKPVARPFSRDLLRW